MINRDPKLILLTLALLFSTLACRTATRLIFPDTPIPLTQGPTAVQPLPEPTRFTETLSSCPVLLSDIMTATTSFGNDAEAQEEQYLVTYKVNGDQISNPYYERVPVHLKDEQQDRTSHEFVWNNFTSIIPIGEREFLTEYSIITDGMDNTLAAVVQTYDDPEHWALEVDILDIEDTYNLTFTLIHEFGHLLTLNAEQVPPSLRVFNNPDDEDIYWEEVDTCPDYFPGEGCSTSTSYINTFYDRFWADIYDEWDEVNFETDDDAYYEALDNFYYKYEDQFVTDYAVTTPEEDIAESWSFFVLDRKPNGDTIAEQKVLFFYEYPELVQLRKEILNGVCNSFPK